MVELVIDALSAHATAQKRVQNKANHPTVDTVSFALRGGEFVALLGPNGAGKTTLLRAILGLGRRASGRVTIDDKPVGRMRTGQRARAMAYLPQSRPLAWPVSVRNLVALGRFAHGAGAGRLSDTDADAVDQALAACELTSFANRASDTLSGGELARVHVARALAARAPIVLADEPVAALDPKYQHQVMGILADFVAKGGAALVVIHDVGLAAQYASRLIWMRDGQILADGGVEHTLTPQRMADVYGVTAQIDGRRVHVTGVV